MTRTRLIKELRSRGVHFIDNHELEDCYTVELLRIARRKGIDSASGRRE